MKDAKDLFTEKELKELGEKPSILIMALDMVHATGVLDGIMFTAEWLSERGVAIDGKKIADAYLDTLKEKKEKKEERA